MSNDSRSSHNTLGLLASLVSAALSGGSAMADETARLDVTREQGRVELRLTSPADTLFPAAALQHADHRQQVLSSGAALLGDAGSLFHLPPAAACRLVETRVEGTVMEAAGLVSRQRPGERLRELRQRDVPLGGHPAQQQPTGDDESSALKADGQDDSCPPAEIDVHHVYLCQRPDQLTQIGAQLFSAFPGLQRLDVTLQTTTASDQVTLTPRQPVLRMPPR